MLSLSLLVVLRGLWHVPGQQCAQIVWSGGIGAERGGCYKRSCLGPVLAPVMRPVSPQAGCDWLPKHNISWKKQKNGYQMSSVSNWFIWEILGTFENTSRIDADSFLGGLIWIKALVIQPSVCRWGTLPKPNIARGNVQISLWLICSWVFISNARPSRVWFMSRTRLHVSLTPRCSMIQTKVKSL